MTDHHLFDLLQQAADRVPVGAAPLAEMAARAGRHRRRRALAVTLAGVSAVVTTAGGTALLAAPRGAPAPQPAASPGPVVTPVDTRLVGLGHAAIAVPAEWGTNATECGMPQRDTVVIDAGGVRTCGTSRPDGVDSVELTQGARRFDFHADQTIRVDGVPAERQATACAPGGFGGGTVCAGTVYVPSLGVSFRAESSTGAADVDRILGWIRIVPDRVGVPGFQTVGEDQQGRVQEKYVEALRTVGLVAEIRTKKVPTVDPGSVLDVSPAPGTMLPAGAVVTVTVVAAPEGPADEVAVGMTTEDTRNEYRELTDEQIRSGATIELGVGDRIWAYAHGKRAGTLAGELDGSSLAVDGRKDGPNYPHSWVAVGPGRTTVSLTIVADGKPVLLGVVTVVVN